MQQRNFDNGKFINTACFLQMTFCTGKNDKLFAGFSLTAFHGIENVPPRENLD
jgi:hypothetical protein